MRFAVTGAAGFLGWHARCAIKARGDQFVTIDRRVARDPNLLAAAVSHVDAVLHLAGVNRAQPHVLREQNLSLARALTKAVDRANVRPTVVYANSIQSGNGTAFGDGKQAAADHLFAWAAESGTPFVDVHLPNIFGEHGRPHYNSVVASFCHELANGGRPDIDQDRALPLLHSQDAVDQLLALAVTGRDAVVSPPGRNMTVSALLALLIQFRDLYRIGDIPEISDPLHLALFNTYRSFVFPGLYPIRPKVHSDDRGDLFECVRAHGGQSQVFCSTTRPGVTRGEHFHLRKVERFLVIAGEAEIALRRLFDDHIVQFQVSGGDPAMVDMPTMWVHSITNIGSGELTTLFWAHEILDPQAPDTYPEQVRAHAQVAE